MHIFDLIFPEQVCLFPSLFPEQGQKIYIGRHLPVHMSTVTPLGYFTAWLNGCQGYLMDNIECYASLTVQLEQSTQRFLFCSCRLLLFNPNLYRGGGGGGGKFALQAVFSLQLQNGWC